MSDYQSVPDEAILQMVPSMCDLLGLKRLTPRRLVWKNSLSVGRGGSIPVPVAYPFISGRQMILALRAQGILTLEQWKPVLGSSLLVNSWAKPRAVRTFAVGIIAVLAYYIPILVLTLGTNMIGGNTGSILITPILPAFIFIITVILYARSISPEAHKEALRADLQVAGLVGRELFLEALQRIESAGFTEVQKLDRKPSRYKQPSIQERIQNLQTR